MPIDFPYAMHVETIRKALWRPRSRAAVMVGSGFSRNADATTSSAPPLPLWGDIVSRLQKELGSTNPDPLRLAEEYEYAASRTALDDLLLEMVPDGKYQPGQLHEMLLSLPWSDVFTSNYDTLIERTRPKIHELKYDVVLTPADIARSEKPRIVKLHGSFPSHRPFIFTAEDYRKYPKDFAPFVNMVQQSIMENVFCMIGFSGNDPNFTQWIGWVRDQLGSSAPKIYLCDVLDINPVKERLYQSMRVVPIDLGSLVPKSHWTEDLRRPKALEWFLTSLHQGKPVDLRQWPQKQLKFSSRFQFDIKLPPALDNSELPAWMDLPNIKSLGEFDSQTRKKLVKRWRIEREGYPGWVIIPESNRQILLQETWPWLSEPTGAKISQTLTEATAAEKLEFLYELVWRTRRCLVPLPDWLATTTQNVLEQVNPKPELIQLPKHTLKPEIPAGNTDVHTNSWVFLAFSIINRAWQKPDSSTFAFWIDALKGLAPLKPEWRAQWHHEQCWHSLLLLDEEAVRKNLTQWPMQEGLPFWEAKRAAIHAELGSLDEASRIAENALTRVRQGAATASIDYVNLSMEGWIVEFLELLAPVTEDATRNRKVEFTARLRELRRYHCDPLEDMEQRVRSLTMGSDGNTAYINSQFEPGRPISRPSPKPIQSLDTWMVLQMFHDGAWHMRSGQRVISPKGLSKIIAQLWPQSPQLAIGVGTIAGRPDKLQEVLTRVDVALLSQSTAHSLHDWLSTSFTKAMESAHSIQSSDREFGLWVLILVAGPEVLSRLTLRLSPHQLEAAFEIALKMHELELFQQPLWHGLIERFFSRILFSASADQIYKWLPRLLELPIVGHDGFDVDSADTWPELIENIPWSRKWRRPDLAERETWAKAVENLTKLVQNGPTHVREQASFRLALIVDQEVMTEKQIRSFVGALWNKTDAVGFPADVGFAPWVLLEMPDIRQPGDSRRAFISYLLDDQDIEDFAQYAEWIDLATAYPWSAPDKQKFRIVWTSDEAVKLLHRLLRWLEDKRPNIPAGIQKSSLPQKLKKQLWQIVILLGKVIIPALNPEKESKSLQEAKKLMAECEAHGYSLISVLPSMLLTDTSQLGHTEQRLFRALLGSRERDVAASTTAMLRWAAFALQQRLPPLPSKLLAAWVEVIVSRRQPGLSHAIQNLATFIERFGNTLPASHTDSLCEALDYLIEETLPAALQAKDDLPLSSQERINIRWQASRLAASLDSLYQQRDLASPAILGRWREVAAVDPLPEVRRAWQNRVTTPSP